MIVEVAQAAHKPVHVACRYKVALDAVLDQVRPAAMECGHHRQATRHGLQDAQAEAVLEAGQREDISSARFEG
jgi:hypothetical protein